MLEIPNWYNILLRIGMITWAIKLGTVSMIPVGYSSVITMKWEFWPGIWPKSELICDKHFGNGDILNGSLVVVGVATWHAMHFCTVLWTIRSMKENNTFSLIKTLLLTMPWCPECARSTALCCRFLRSIFSFHGIWFPKFCNWQLFFVNWANVNTWLLMSQVPLAKADGFDYGL